jgi:hypothetical protein
MTEAEWLACDDPQKMLAFLRANKENRTRCGRRRLRLFGCACCGRIRRLMTERGVTGYSRVSSMQKGC